MMHCNNLPIIITWQSYFSLLFGVIHILLLHYYYNTTVYVWWPFLYHIFLGLITTSTIYRNVYTFLSCACTWWAFTYIYHFSWDSSQHACTLYRNMYISSSSNIHDPPSYNHLARVWQRNTFLIIIIISCHIVAVLHTGLLVLYMCVINTIIALKYLLFMAFLLSCLCWCCHLL